MQSILSTVDQMYTDSFLYTKREGNFLAFFFLVFYISKGY
jgi:hypothetical protein